MTDRREVVRAAFERGRWRRAAPWAVPALLLAAAAFASGSHSALVVGPVLALGLVGLRHRGGDLGRGAVTGLLAGTLPFVLIVGWKCSGTCSPVSCAAIGVLSGVGAALVLARGLQSQSTGWAVSAVAVAAATSALPCFALGAHGLLVIPALLAASAVPATVLRRI